MSHACSCGAITLPAIEVQTLCNRVLTEQLPAYRQEQWVSSWKRHQERYAATHWFWRWADKCIWGNPLKDFATLEQYQVWVRSQVFGAYQDTAAWGNEETAKQLLGISTKLIELHGEDAKIGLTLKEFEHISWV